MEYLLVGVVCAAGLVLPVVLGFAQQQQRRRRTGPPGRSHGAF
ncbi:MULTISPECIES: hypothetical protein [Microbacterium]|nr:MULTISPECIES: hypothetical protein [Microbacterium]